MHGGDGHPAAVDHYFLEGFETVGSAQRQSATVACNCIGVNPSAAAAVSHKGQDEPADAAWGEVWVGVHRAHSSRVDAWVERCASRPAEWSPPNKVARRPGSSARRRRGPDLFGSGGAGGLPRPDETQEDIIDILNTPTSFPHNGHRFRVGVDDGRTCDCGHIADSLLDRWRHLYAVGALISASNN